MWALPEGDFLASLTTYSLSLMLFRLFTAASIALGSMMPMAAEAGSSCGVASFYGTASDGYAWQTMANGQPMNPSALTTAHPWLPFGTRLRVTNQRTGKSVTVRVTDRGPAYGRVLDLSPGAFSRIASLGSGLADVCFSKL